jgi:hypothetical protein
MGITTTLNCLIAAPILRLKTCVSVPPLWSVFCQLKNAKASLEPLELRFSHEVSKEKSEEPVEIISQTHPSMDKAFNGKQSLPSSLLDTPFIATGTPEIRG